MKKILLAIVGFVLISPLPSHAASVTSDGGMSFIAKLFNKVCLNNNNTFLTEKKIDNNNTYIVFENYRFQKLIHDNSCSISTGTEDGITNISPLNYIANKYAEEHQLDVFQIPVEEIEKNGIINRYLVYIFSKKYGLKNYQKINSAWSLNYILYKDKPIQKKDEFIFSDTPKSYDNVKITLTKLTMNNP